jgi:hypothetical protein
MGGQAREPCPYQVLRASSHFSTGHKKKIAFFAVSEFKSMNDKAVVQGYARICLHTIIAVTKTNFNTRDFHSVSSMVQCSMRRSVISADDFSPAKTSH